MCGIHCGDHLHSSAPPAERKLQLLESIACRLITLWRELWRSIIRSRSLPKCQYAKDTWGSLSTFSAWLICSWFVGYVLLVVITPGMSSVLLKMPTLRKGMPLSPSSRALRPGDGEMLFLAWIPWKLAKGNLYNYWVKIQIKWRNFLRSYNTP